MSTSPISATRPDQPVMTPKVGFSINIFHVVEFIFSNVKSCKHDTHEKYADSEQENEKLRIGH